LLEGCYVDADESACLDYADASQVTLTSCHVAGLSGKMLTARELDLTGSTLTGPLYLLGARITGQLDCRSARVAGADSHGYALVADGLKAGAVFLGGFTAHGTVQLAGADIAGNLECEDARLASTDRDGYALVADGLKAGAVFLGGFTADGAVRLARADITGQLDCRGARLAGAGRDGYALMADGLKAGAVFLGAGFTAVGDGGAGAVRLVGAHIGGNLECNGASLRNDSGPALFAEGLQVGQSMFLRRGFTAIGGGDAAVNLVGAHIGGSFQCDGARLRNDSGPALDAYGLQVGQSMFLGDGFTAIGGGVVAVNLTDARVGGTLYFDPERLEHATDSQGRVAVNGLTYTGVPAPISARDWLDLLRDGTRRYAAQPYQQLAAGYRAQGDERQARQIMMAQRDDELTRTDIRWPGRLWGKITKVTLGYGYRPWRALLFLAAVLVISCLLAITLGSHGALAQTSNTAAPGRQCTVIQQVSVGLDLNLPMGTSLARAGCDLTTDAASTTAAWLATIGWVLRLLAWVFVALFIAGFTSAVRKT
jgi:hypothetical protein